MAYSVITISGNITRDPETIDLKDGRKGVRIGVAVNKSKETVVFYNILFTEQHLVDRITNYAKKGSSITLIGDHSKNKVEDVTYENIYGISINELFTRNNDDKDNTPDVATNNARPTTPKAPARNTTPPANNAPASSNFAPDLDDDDLPF